MTSTSNVRSVKDARERKKSFDEQEINDLLAVLSIVEGRRLLWRILSNCRIYESPGCANGSIQSQNVGRQDVGKELIAWLCTADPLAYPKMMIEMAEKKD